MPRIEVTPGIVPVLAAFRDTVCRPGTARAMAQAVLTDALGQPKDECLHRLERAERQWQKIHKRATTSCNPSGWLKFFRTEFK